MSRITNHAAQQENYAPTDSKDRKLSDKQIHDLAELVAEGDCEFPSDLSDTDRSRLVQEGRQLLRVRLINTLAKIIAADIERESPETPR